MALAKAAPFDAVAQRQIRPVRRASRADATTLEDLELVISWTAFGLILSWIATSALQLPLL